MAASEKSVDEQLFNRRRHPIMMVCKSLEASHVLYRQDRSAPMSGEAEVKYLDGDFRVVKPGAFVRCAVTGVAIPLEELKYWSVEKQEAYVSPDAVMQSLSGVAPA